MKSEKAMEYVGRHNWPDEDTNIRAIYCYHVQDAIELAEQEAEEQMREKALKVFCASNCPKGCSFGADGNIGCGAKARFIQKLNEE